MKKKRKRKMNRYVVHYCPKCNNCWIDKDLTNVKTLPPKWKLCKECCKKLGIDFNSQKPSNGKIKNTTKLATSGSNLNENGNPKADIKGT